MRRPDSELAFATVAMGLVAANVVRIDPNDPETLERLRDATEKVCSALWPNEPKGPRAGFYYPDLERT
jgi:hypothetical protein